MRTRRSQSSSNSMLSSSEIPQETMHRSVLLHETVELLALQADDVVVDGTLGGAGHALAIAKQLGRDGVLIGVDADQEAIERARALLVHPAPSGEVRPSIVLVNDNFRNIATFLDASGYSEVDKILLDLGWSSFQLSAGRGFSFQRDEPLSMAYSTTQSLHAGVIVNTWEETSIADVIYGWGEERYARIIAKAIVRARELKRIETSRELAEIIKASVPTRYRYGRIHPATRTFQAIRIATNDEIGALEQALTDGWRRLSQGGRMAIITFHSIEDRIVKHRYASWVRDQQGTLVHRKPIVPSDAELAANPRARSAKLRVIEKI